MTPVSSSRGAGSGGGSDGGVGGISLFIFHFSGGKVKYGGKVKSEK